MNIKISGSQNVIHHQLRSPTVFLLLLLKLTKDVKNILTIKKYNNIISYSVNTVQYICLIFS